jgi:hypothetical protein
MEITTLSFRSSLYKSLRLVVEESVKNSFRASRIREISSLAVKANLFSLNDLISSDVYPITELIFSEQ